MKKAPEIPAGISLAALSLATVILLALPLALSFWNNSEYLSSSDYLHLRLSRINALDVFAHIDPLSPESAQGYTPYHALLGLVSLVFPSGSSFIILGLLLGLCALLLSWRILALFGLDQKRSIIACVIIMLAPGFISLYSHAHPTGLALVLILLLIATHLSSKSFFSILCVTLLALTTASFGGVHAALSFSLLFFFSFAERITTARGKTYITGSVLALLVGWLLPAPPRAAPLEFPFGIISELGNVNGAGIFLVLTSLVGCYVLWKRKAQWWPVYALFASLLGAVFFFDSAAIWYALLIMAAFSSAAIVRFLDGEWEIQLMRSFTVSIILFGLIFSPIALYVSEPADIPSTPLVESLRFLRQQPPGTVLTLPEYGTAVQFISQKKIASMPGINERLAWEIFQIRNPQRLSERLAAIDARYVVIDTHMRSGGVWKTEDEGLLFALHDDSRFLLLYRTSGAEIWLRLR